MLFTSMKASWLCMQPMIYGITKPLLKRILLRKVSTNTKVPRHCVVQRAAAAVVRFLAARALNTLTSALYVEVDPLENVSRHTCIVQSSHSYYLQASLTLLFIKPQPISSHGQESTLTIWRSVTLCLLKANSLQMVLV